MRAYYIGSGGLGGLEGSVHLFLKGDENTLGKVFELVKIHQGGALGVSVLDIFFQLAGRLQL